MKITISILVLGFLCIGIAGYVYALIENGDFSDITLKGNFPLSRVAFLKLGKGGLHKDPSINRVESWGDFIKKKPTAIFVREYLGFVSFLGASRGVLYGATFNVNKDFSRSFFANGKVERNQETGRLAIKCTKNIAHISLLWGFPFCIVCLLLFALFFIKKFP